MNNNTSVAIDEGLGAFVFLGRGTIFGFLPASAVVFAVLLAIGHIMLNHTRFGRYVMAIGGQEESAVMMGLPTRRTKMLVYILCGAMASMAGLVLCARMGAGQPQSGISWGMDIMAIVVIGGTRIRGGKGNMVGVIIGALIMNMVSNMINLFGNINAYVQDIINACIAAACRAVPDLLREPVCPPEQGLRCAHESWAGLHGIHAGYACIHGNGACTPYWAKGQNACS